MNDAERSASEYDAMAADYAADNAVNAFNAFYERPATIALLGDVEGRAVLEAGCGSGVLTAWLAEKGAAVTAFDLSPVMVDIASRRVGDRAKVLVADVGQPLFFAEDEAFDLVVASLVLHYVRDWKGVLGEFRRVLKHDGRIVVSTHHPAMDWQLHSSEDYFSFKQVTETWAKGSGQFEVTFWRRPLTTMCDDIAAADLLIERLVEPAPLPELAEIEPGAFDLLSSAPRFLFFRLVRPCAAR
jgi:ubiquinone/menaquinone biosynthesis C-methylase UbiE